MGGKESLRESRSHHPFMRDLDVDLPYSPLLAVRGGESFVGRGCGARGLP